MGVLQILIQTLSRLKWKSTGILWDYERVAFPKSPLAIWHQNFGLHSNFINYILLLVPSLNSAVVLINEEKQARTATAVSGDN